MSELTGDGNKLVEPRTSSQAPRGVELDTCMFFFQEWYAMLHCPSSRVG